MNNYYVALACAACLMLLAAIQTAAAATVQKTATQTESAARPWTGTSGKVGDEAEIRRSSDQDAATTLKLVVLIFCCLGLMAFMNRLFSRPKRRARLGRGLDLGMLSDGARHPGRFGSAGGFPGGGINGEGFRGGGGCSGW